MTATHVIEQARSLYREQKYQDALLLLDAERLKNNHPSLLLEMAALLASIGQMDAAGTILDQGLRQFADNQSIVIAYANHTYKTNQPEKGLRIIAPVVQSPECGAELVLTYAHLLKASGKYGDAERAYRNVLEKDNHNPIALAGLGGLQLDECDYASAIQSFQAALAASPNNAHIKTQLAYAYFRNGDLENGWKHYAARFGDAHTPGIVKTRPFQAPLWDGAPVTKGKLLVWCEQGVGEELLYSTMLNDVRGFAPGGLIVECDGRLKSLFERSFDGITFVVRSDPPDPQLVDGSIAMQCPAGHCGQYVRSTLAAFPKSTKPLVPNLAQTTITRARYEDMKAKLGKTGNVIGVSWKSKPLRQGDPKSSTLQDWAPLFEDSPHLFVSLQYGNIANDLGLAKEKNWSLFSDAYVNQAVSLDDFASQIAAMDSIITVSNTTAHMAGICGKKTAVLLPKSRGLMWHWFDNLTSSPWYPSVTLLRQTVDGKWDDVIIKAKAFL